LRLLDLKTEPSFQLHVNGIDILDDFAVLRAGCNDCTTAKVLKANTMIKSFTTATG